MKLFAIRDNHTRTLLPPTFSSKKEAKAERDRLNAEAGTQRYVVTPGPDHWRYKA